MQSQLSGKISISPFVDSFATERNFLIWYIKSLLHPPSHAFGKCSPFWPPLITAVCIAWHRAVRLSSDWGTNLPFSYWPRHYLFADFVFKSMQFYGYKLKGSKHNICNSQIYTKVGYLVEIYVATVSSLDWDLSSESDCISCTESSQITGKFSHH